MDVTPIYYNHALVRPNEEPELSKKDPAPYKRTILVTTSVFMGYAALVVLQHRLKNVHDEVKHPEDATEFKHASTLNYVGNLIFRIAHNFIFFFLSPRLRVHVALGSMALAMGLLSFMMCISKSPWIGWVFISYFLGGVAIGTFESNLLNCITPLGHGTKKWAIFGMPLGFNLISVGGFLLLQAGVPLVALYLAVLVSCVCSMGLFAFGVPVARPSDDGSATTTARPALASLDHVSGGGIDAAQAVQLEEPSYFQRFKGDLVAWRAWYPQISWHTIALMADMYCVSFFSGIMLYLLNDSREGGAVALLGPNQLGWGVVPHDDFFAVYNVFTFFGDTLSRQLVYRAPRLVHPFWFLLLSALGAALCLIKIPLVAPLGILLVFFANGAVYATSTKHIDQAVDRRYNLTALSIWLFIGDLGSVLGSNTWPLVAPLVCKGVHAPHMCVPPSNSSVIVNASLSFS